MSNHHRAKQQLAITKLLSIPENKPDIERILKVTSTPQLHKTSTIPGTVTLTGKVNIFMEYVACSDHNSQPIHFSEFEIPFAHFIDHRCIKRCQKPNVCISVEFQEIEVINRRSITIFLILKAALLKGSSSNTQIHSQICPMEHITNLPLGQSLLCSQLQCIEDPSSISQACSFGSCVIEREC